MCIRDSIKGGESVDALFNPDRAGRGNGEHDSAARKAVHDLGVRKRPDDFRRAADDLVRRAVVRREIGNKAGNDGGGIEALVDFVADLEAVENIHDVVRVERRAIALPGGEGLSLIHI